MSQWTLRVGPFATIRENEIKRQRKKSLDSEDVFNENDITPEN